MKCKKCNTNGQLSGVHTKYVLVIIVWYVIMPTRIVRYENEYNDYMKKKKMMMMITTSELGTAIISSTDFVDCGEMCVMWYFFLQRRFLYFCVPH